MDIRGLGYQWVTQLLAVGRASCRARVFRRVLCRSWMYFCPNVSVPGRVLETSVHFAHVMDIRGLGYQRVTQLLESKLITDVADLYDITAEQLVALEGFAKKSAQQLVDAIAESKQRPLSTFLFALGIRHVGGGVARTLAREFGSLERLKAATIEQVSDVTGIGSIIADAVIHFFAEERNQVLLAEFARHGFQPTEPRGSAEGPLAGQTYEFRQQHL